MAARIRPASQGKPGQATFPREEVVGSQQAEILTPPGRREEEEEEAAEAREATAATATAGAIA